MTDPTPDFDPALLDGFDVVPPSDDAEDQDAAPQRTRRRRSDAGVKRGTTAATTRGRKPNTRKVVDNLLEPWALLAKSMAPKAPTGSAVMLHRGEVTCQALVDIAAKHPRMMKALESIGTIGPAAVLIQTSVEVFLAVQMDFGRIPVDHPMAYGLGLSQLYHQVHPVEPYPAYEEDTPTQTQPPAGFIPASDPRHPMYSWTAGNRRSRFADNPFGVQVPA